MNTGSDSRFDAEARRLGHAFDGEMKVGGHYAPIVTHGDLHYISGQVPRVGSTVVVTGRVGAQTSLADARRAAEISAMRALALLRQALGSLEQVRQILRVTVYVQCAPDFTLHSEVADAASDLIHAVLGPRGVHSRTSVGVYQLPKDASVELDMIAAAWPQETGIS